MADDTADPFAKYAGKHAVGEGAASADDPFAKYTKGSVPDPNAPGLAESLMRGAAEGATFGFDDKLGLDKKRREASKKANPWTHFMGEVVGGFVPMAAAAALPTGATQAAAAGRGAQLIQKGAQLARAAFTPGEIATVGQALKQGAKLGAVYGGLSGAGHADVKPEDDLASSLAKRVEEGVKGSAIGAAIGAPLGVVGHGIYRGAQALGGMRAAANAETDVGSGALKTAVNRLERDRITPDDLIAQIRSEFPAPRNGIGATEVEDVVRRAMAGETAQDISTALAQKGIQQTPHDIQGLLDDLAARHLGPLNLVDRAAMVRKGSGDNTQMTMRAAAATPGEHVGVARENLLERQMGAQGRLGDMFERVLGSRDFEGVARRHDEALRDAGAKAYNAAFAQERPFDLQPIFDKWDAKFDKMRGIVPDAMRARLKSMMWEETNAAGQTVRVPPQNLEGFMFAREGVRDLIGELPQGNNLRRYLTNFYNEMTNEVAQTNPLWKEANNIWRDGMAGKEAMEAGAAMVTRLNNKSRENLNVFTQAQKDMGAAEKALETAAKPIEAARAMGRTPSPADLQAHEAANAALEAAKARNDLFKVGFVRALNDALANQGETHNLTKQLVLPGAQKILKQILGPDADQFMKVVRAEAAMHRTYQSQFGSQTTPLREHIDELNWAPKFEASWHNLGLGKALQLAQEYTARNINNQRNADLMRLYMETDPVKQLEALRAMQALHAARSDAGNMVGRPAVGLGSGVWPEALVSDRGDQVRTPALKPYKP